MQNKDVCQNNIPSTILTTAEAADYLRVSRLTLRNWRSTRAVSLPYLKVGRAVRYRLADLQSFLEANLRGGDCAA